MDDAVEALSSLMEPIIMVVLGTLIGGMVIAMYCDLQDGLVVDGVAACRTSLFTGWFFLFSLLVGSFLNVAIHRLPRMMEADWHAQCAELRGEPVPGCAALQPGLPRSACPQCGHTITALGNYSAAVVAVVARPLLGLPRADRRALSAGGTAYRAAVAAVAWKWGAACKTRARCS